MPEKKFGFTENFSRCTPEKKDKYFLLKKILPHTFWWQKFSGTACWRGTAHLFLLQTLLNDKFSLKKILAPCFSVAEIFWKSLHCSVYGFSDIFFTRYIFCWRRYCPQYFSVTEISAGVIDVLQRSSFRSQTFLGHLQSLIPDEYSQANQVAPYNP